MVPSDRHADHHARRPSMRWQTREIVIGTVQYAVGTLLIAIAWVLIASDQDRAAASALLPGLLILVFTDLNLIRFRAAFERMVACLGLWTLLSPWALGFSAQSAAAWTHVALGGVTVVCAAVWLRHARTS